MANYIQGAPQDYIPKLNFKPDLNFYNYALQTKEAQYKEGYSKISGVYGTLFNSPMLRDPDIRRRDQFFKQAQMEIQKMSEVDLSLNDNVQQAYQVFQPLIDDQNITSDIAYTKQYYNERSREESLRTMPRTKDNEGMGEWDPIASRALDYWAEDYSRTDDNEALSFDKPRFVPFFNAVKEGLKVIKDMKISAKTTGTDGRYIYTTTNGERIVGDLTDILKGVVGNDSRIAATYQTMAYVAYKDAVKTGISKYGNEQASEDNFLSTVFTQSSDNLKKQKKRTDNTKQVLDAGMFLIKDEVSNSPVKSDNPLVQQYLNWMQQKKVLDQTQQGQDAALSNIDQKVMLGLDKRIKRQRILGVYADQLLHNDLYRAAHDYAMLTKETEMKADPYGEIEARFKNDMIKMQYEHDFKIKYAVATGKLKNKKDLTEAGFEPVPIVGESAKEDTRVNTTILRDKFLRSTWKIADQTNSEVFLQLYNTLVNSSDDKKRIVAKNQIDTYFGEGAADRAIQSGSTDLNTIIPGYNSKRDGIFKLIRTSSDNLDMFNTGLRSKLTQAGNEYDTNNQAMVTVHNTLKENDQKLKSYLLPQDPAWKDMFSNLGLVTKSEFVNKVPDEFKQQASKKYDELYQNYQDAYASNDVTLNLKSYRGNQNVGGISMQGARTHIDANTGATPNNVAVIDAIKGMDREGIIGVAPGNTPADKSNMLAPGSTGYNQAYHVLKNFANDLNADITAGGKSKKITSGDITLLPISTSDPSVSGFFVQPSEAWIQKYDGTSKAKGITYDPKIKDGFTILYKKDQAPAIFDQFSPSPVSIILDHGPYEIKGYEQFGGKIKFEKTPSGTVNTTGFVKHVDKNSYPNLKLLTSDTDPETGASIASLGRSLTGNVDYQVKVLTDWLGQWDEKNRRIMALPHGDNLVDKKKLDELDNYVPGDNPDNTNEE